MVSKVDYDGSGSIEFEEFLKIINSKDASNLKERAITSFCKDLYNGHFGDRYESFPTFV